MSTGLLRAQADRLRAIPLEAVLRCVGAQPDLHDRHKWHTSVGTLSVTAAKFINWSRGTGGGGAIDLVIHLKGLRFLEALEWLASHCPSAPALTSAAPAPRPALQLPPPDPQQLERVERYLTVQRGIAPALVLSLIKSGVLYADARANAVFLLLGNANSPVGAELRGTTPCQWRGMAPGSRKDLGFFSVPAADPKPTIILCESAIDALSCALLFPHARGISTSGARPSPAWLASLIAHAAEVHCGFDADATGDHMAAQMIAVHPSIRRLRPSLHDWNDVLRSAA